MLISRDKIYNPFLTKKSPNEDKILFQIQNVLSKMKKGKEENFDANLELRDLTEKNGMKSNKQITDRNNSAADIANTECRAQNIFSRKI